MEGRGRRRGELEMGGGEEGERLKERGEEEDWDRGVKTREGELRGEWRGRLREGRTRARLRERRGRMREKGEMRLRVMGRGKGVRGRGWKRKLRGIGEERD